MFLLPYYYHVFLFIISFSAGSIPSAIAGNESLTRLIHNSCIANNGVSSHNKSPKNIATISPMFVAIKK